METFHATSVTEVRITTVAGAKRVCIVLKLGSTGARVCVTMTPNAFRQILDQQDDLRRQIDALTDDESRNARVLAESWGKQDTDAQPFRGAPGPGYDERE